MPPDISLRRSLRARLTITGLAIWTAAAVLFGIAAIGVQRSALQNMAMDRLAMVAHSRLAQIESVMALATRQVQALAAAERTRAILAGIGRADDAAWLQGAIVYPALSMGRISLVAADGGTLATAGDAAHHPLPHGLALQSVSELFWYPAVPDSGEPPAFELVEPVRADLGGGIAGWVRVRFYVDRLYSILLDQSGLESSGETYLVAADGRRLSPSRFANHPLGEALGSTWAVRSVDLGGETTGTYQNYRGVAVIGAAVPLPSLNWTLGVETEAREVLAPVRRLGAAMLAVGALIALLGTAVAAFLSARDLSRLTALQAAATAIAEGKWDVQVPVTGEDEVGSLGIAFNRMTAAIAAALSAREASETKLAGILDAAPDAVIAIDEGGRIILFNRAAEVIFGYTAAEALGSPLPMLMPQQYAAAHGNHVQRFAAGSGHARSMGERQAVYGRRKNGDEFPAEASIARLQTNSQTLFISVFRDVTERKSMETRLVELANLDALTGLCNRRRFEAELQYRLAPAKAPATGGAILYLDLDQFKYINDSRGHQAGDELLKNLAALLRGHMRGTDLLARQGGDEFAAILQGAGAAEAQAVAERILEALRRTPIPAGGQPVHVSASIGIALFPEHGTTPAEIFACADLALYRAKEVGRDVACLFTPGQELRQQADAKLSWDRRIREALKDDGFVLHAQPILHLPSRRVTHYELLLRMLGPRGELILPGSFLNVAERFGLIRSIDRWVMRQAIHLLAEWQRVDPSVCLTLNLSAKAFNDGELLSLIQQGLAAVPVDPRSLVLEITETAAITDVTQAREFLGRLKDLGFQIALDDFGTGFASFRHLRDLPVDYLKIDGGFIRDLPHDVADQFLVRSMVGIARGLGKQIVAEYVGDEETARLLQQFGVDYAQGYYIGRPAPIAEMLRPSLGKKPLVS